MNKSELIKADNKKAGKIVDLNIIIDNKDLVISELKKSIGVLENSVKRTRTLNQVLTNKVDELGRKLNSAVKEYGMAVCDTDVKKAEIRTLVEAIAIISETNDL